MKVLVTGATGFIGNHVINELLNHGITIIASSAHINKARSCQWFDKVLYKVFDINAPGEITDLYDYFERPDAVIHLAWAGLPNYKSDHHLDINLPAHEAFIENLLKHGARDITVTGTCFEYGMKEGMLQEAMAPHPENTYAIAKNELRKNIEQLQGQYEFSFKWLRLFYMYGKGQAPGSLIAQLDAALQRGDEVFNMSGGEQVRDFLPVEKVATCIVKIALQKKVDGIINICSNKPIAVKDFVLNYLEERNKKIKLNLGFYPYPDFEPMRFWGDNEKLISIE